MKIVIAALILVAMSTGCAETFKRIEQEEAQRKAEDAAANTALISRIVDAEVDSWVLCIGKDQCDKAFKFTKLYIMQNADYKIASSDDMSISTHSYNIYNQNATYQIRFADLIYMNAIKMPVKGVDGAERIMIKADCGEYHKPYFKGTPKCIDTVVKIYKGFKPFIEAQL